MITSWTLALDFRIHNLPLFLQQSKIGASLRKGERERCVCVPHGPPPSWAFACPLFLQTHRACRIQRSVRQMGLHGKESEREETFLHGGTTLRTLKLKPLLPLQPDRCGAACRSTSQSSPLLFCTCTVSWLQGCNLFGYTRGTGRGKEIIAL